MSGYNSNYRPPQHRQQAEQHDYYYQQQEQAAGQYPQHDVHSQPQSGRGTPMQSHVQPEPQLAPPVAGGPTFLFQPVRQTTTANGASGSFVGSSRSSEASSRRQSANSSRRSYTHDPYNQRAESSGASSADDESHSNHSGLESRQHSEPIIANPGDNLHFQNAPVQDWQSQQQNQHPAGLHYYYYAQQHQQQEGLGPYQQQQRYPATEYRPQQFHQQAQPPQHPLVQPSVNVGATAKQVPVPVAVAGLNKSGGTNSSGTASATNLVVPKEGAKKKRRGGKGSVPSVVDVESIKSLEGRAMHLLSTPGGSSFFQCALAQFPEATCELLAADVLSHLSRLLLDKHACYVAKAVLEVLPHKQTFPAITETLQNEAFVVMLCTKDLHSRRMMQFLLELSLDEFGPRIIAVANDRVFTIADTAHGCISLQRLLDKHDLETKERFFNVAVRPNLTHFAVREHAHFIVCYMLSEGNNAANTAAVEQMLFPGAHESTRLLSMICAKHSAEVVEKALSYVSVELQQRIITSIFTMPESPAALTTILLDANANYVVQSAIRYAQLDALVIIRARCIPLCSTIANGTRLQRLVERAEEKCQEQH